MIEFGTGEYAIVWREVKSKKIIKIIIFAPYYTWGFYKRLLEEIPNA